MTTWLLCVANVQYKTKQNEAPQNLSVLTGFRKKEIDWLAFMKNSEVVLASTVRPCLDGRA